MFSSPKAGSTAHPVRIDIPVELLEQIDAIGKHSNCKTRNRAILLILERGVASLEHTHV